MPACECQYSVHVHGSLRNTDRVRWSFEDIPLTVFDLSLADFFIHLMACGFSTDTEGMDGLSLLHRLHEKGPGIGLLQQLAAAVGVAHVQQAFHPEAAFGQQGA